MQPAQSFWHGALPVQQYLPGDIRWSAFGGLGGKNGTAQSRETKQSGGGQGAAVPGASCALVSVDLDVGRPAPGSALTTGFPGVAAASFLLSADPVPGEILMLCVQLAHRIFKHLCDVDAIVSLDGWRSPVQELRELSLAICSHCSVAAGGWRHRSVLSHPHTGLPPAVPGVDLGHNKLTVRCGRSLVLRIPGSGARLPGIKCCLQLCLDYFNLSSLSL